MKKALFIFAYLLILSFQICFAQPQQQDKQTSLNKISPIILNEDTIILVSPNEEKMNKLKTEMGDDFYIMADDINYYRSLVYNYLIFINQEYSTIQDDVAIFYPQKDGVLHEIKNNNSNLYWWVVLYKHNERKYKIIGLVDFKDEYEKFMSLHHT